MLDCHSHLSHVYDDGWRDEEIFVTVKAYPNPSRGYRETSCVAGLRMRDRAWIRLHPIPFRYLPDESKFRKYDIIRVEVKRSSDPRAESHKVRYDDIRCVRHIGTTAGWAERNDLLLDQRAGSLEELRKYSPSGPSLGLIKVTDIAKLEIIPQDGGWSAKEFSKLRQFGLFDSQIEQLERPPFQFKYSFRCESPSCKGHRMQIMDWETIQTYRKWRAQYGHDWEHHFRKQFEHNLPSKDFHLFVGTMMRRPSQWTIVGIYYPPNARPVLDSAIPVVQRSLWDGVPE